MTVAIVASGSGVPVFNTRFIDVDIADITVSGNEILFGCIGMVDGERPNFLSANYVSTSGTSESMELVSSTVGPGGSPFPAGFIVALKDPSSTSGTISVEFDENAAVMNGLGLLFNGLDSSGGVFLSRSADPINTQLPDFLIEDSGLVVAASGHFVLDMCISESSTHISHILPSGSLAIPAGETSISMHKLSTAYQVSTSGGPVLIERADCGGPFAGVTLTAVSINTV
jgi:hypothetical protein